MIRPDNNVPVNYDACRPDEPPSSNGTPSLFPPYTISNGVAAEVGLDKGVISNLITAGAELSGKEKVVFSVKGAVLQTLTDDELNAVISKPKCKEAIAKRPALFVRGFVKGQRDFQITKDKKIAGNLAISKIGKFSVNYDGNKSISLTDLTTESLIMIVSKVIIDEGSKTARFEDPVELQGVSKIVLDNESFDSEKNFKILILQPGTGMSKIVSPDK